ncbi:hypothetical protein I3J27_30200 [Bradyrhizobium xenonodulans]|uniref:MFS transporter n=1 Tax=Bradyrhizobium xenonodulans TaxID=2736875 RepID=A0ABY7MY44_9BRAD|nr:hypothetical protein [Bradyrhizobium xenonodulans]WBL82846.1 hypothetical protein I3J27_30200 [Bradyrhizobium xenonodulans]
MAPVAKRCRAGRIAQAVAPLAIGLLIEPLGWGVVTASLSFGALAAMMPLRGRVGSPAAEAAAE